jgi:hypothetical protein
MRSFIITPNIIRVIKLRRMESAIHVNRQGEMRNTYRILHETPERKR